MARLTSFHITLTNTAKVKVQKQITDLFNPGTSISTTAYKAPQVLRPTGPQVLIGEWLQLQNTGASASAEMKLYAVTA